MTPSIAMGCPTREPTHWSSAVLTDEGEAGKAGIVGGEKDILFQKIGTCCFGTDFSGVRREIRPMCVTREGRVGGQDVVFQAGEEGLGRV